MPRRPGSIDVDQIDWREGISDNIIVTGSLNIKGKVLSKAEESINKKAISFDGTNDVVVVSDQDEYSPTDGSTDTAFSISAWVYVGDVSEDNGPFVAKSNNTISVRNEYIFKHANGEVQLFIYDSTVNANGNQIRAQANAATLSDSTWHHVVATYDGSTNASGIKLYTDASQTAATNNETGTYVRLRNSSTALTFGATEDAANANRVFEDRMADVVFFDKELSSAEVTEIYNSGKVMNVRNHSAFANVVSWWKMGDDQDTDGSNGIIDYVSGYHGTLTNGASIIDETGLSSDTLDSLNTNTSGSLGIGIKNPDETLHVYGDAKVEGDTTITGSLTVTKASTILSDLTISGSQLKVTSTGPTSLYLQADTDNVTETDTAFIKMTQDGVYLTSYFGYTPNDSQDPEGGSLTGGLSNTLLMSCHNSFPGGPPASSRIQFATEQAVRMTIEDDGKVGIGTTTPETELHINGALTLTERSSDPSNPSEGNSVLWMSDGTGTGDDGDVLIKITAGGVTKTVTLVDFSAS